MQVNKFPKDMIYTTSGFYCQDSNVLIATPLVTQSGKIEYTFDIENKNKLPQCGIRRSPVKEKMSSINDIISIIFCLSLGQRETTPEFSHQFINHYNKTFFTEGWKFSFEMSQTNVTNMQAISNYFHMTRYSKDIASVECLADEYWFVVATIAAQLWLNVNRKVSTCKDFVMPDNTKTCNLKTINVTNSMMSTLKDSIKTFDDAIKIVVGASICGCWRDHSSTNKDLNNAAMQSAVKLFTELASQVPTYHNTRISFVTKKNIEILKKLANKVTEEWIIKNGTDIVYNRLDIDTSKGK